MSKRILVWFRNDLRLHDNEMLVEAVAKSEYILPVYIFDPRQFQQTPYFTQKTGIQRAAFLRENVAALRRTLQEKGGNILLTVGEPRICIPKLVQEHAIDEVYHHREVASEETAVSTRVEDQLWKLKVNLKHFIGHTLYNKEDLPFPVRDIPDAFNQFKKKTERDAIVKPCFSIPEIMHFIEPSDWGELPSLGDLFPGKNPEDLITSTIFKGGEAEALRHLDEFIHTGEMLAQAPSPLKKHEALSKLSAWLAIGSISPRAVYWRLKEAESIYGLKPYFGQIILGLLWRDYFRFMFKKYGNTYFKPEGFKPETIPYPLVPGPKLEKWKKGETGHTIVDQIMQDLNTEGYIPHTARILAASYLIDELKVNWVLGAAYFEEKLIDYCPASNWGNWANIAGIGNDQKLNDHFRFEKQLKSYNPKGLYRQTTGS